MAQNQSTLLDRLNKFEQHQDNVKKDIKSLIADNIFSKNKFSFIFTLLLLTFMFYPNKSKKTINLFITKEFSDKSLLYKNCVNNYSESIIDKKTILEFIENLTIIEKYYIGKVVASIVPSIKDIFSIFPAESSFATEFRKASMSGYYKTITPESLNFIGYADPTRITKKKHDS